MPNEHALPLLEALVAMIVSEYDQIAPDVCALVVLEPVEEMFSDSFLVSQNFESTERLQKIFLVVR